MQPSVPKFSSFRPKAAAPIDSLDDGPVDPKRHQQYAHKGTRRTRNDTLSGQRQHEKDTRPKPVNTPTVREQEDYSKATSFFVDKNGDRNNLTYGENERSKVPAYRTTSHAIVLGERRTRSSAWPASRPLTSLGHVEVARLRAEGRSLRPEDGQDDLNIDDDFVSLKRKNAGHRRNRRGADDHVLGVKAWERDHEKENQDGSTSELSSSSESEGNTGLDQEKEFRAERARLSSKLKLEPQNMQAWLDYIHHQDLWSDHTSTDAQKSVAEVKLAIFSKALKVVPRTDSGWGTLVSEMMEQAEKVWETSLVAKRWEELLKTSGNSPTLYVEYLNFSMRSSSGFDYERILAIFKNCLLSTHEQSNEPLEIYLLMRLTIFMQEAGMEELAVALWQAVLELKLFSLKSSRVDRGSLQAEQRTMFEEFWESEQARIGEPEAAGWFSGHIQPSAGGDHKDKEVQPSASSRANDPFAAWSEAELFQTRRDRLPGRTSGAEDDGDPFHVVLYSDLAPYLEILRFEMPVELLLEAFLCFNRLPPLPRSHPGASWYTDPFLVRATSSPDSSTTSKNLPTTNSDSQQLQEILFSANSIPRSLKTTTEVLFAQDTKDNFFGDLDLISANFAVNVLKLLVKALPDYDDLGEYSLAFELVTCPKQARKTAKSLLKERSSNLRLYNAYGLIEARLGFEESSDRVFSTAISMSATLGSRGQRGVGLLRRTWAWEALRKGDSRVALERLTFGQEGNPHAPRSVSQRDAAFQAGDYYDAAIQSECLALLSYLANGNDIIAAIDIFHTELILLQSGTGTHSAYVEHLHQARAQLLDHHVRFKHAYKPTTIRAALEESIRAFPHNTAFLALYAETEARFRIDDRVRQVVRAVAPSSQSVIHWAHAIQNEVARAGYQASTAHSIRSVYEAAVASRCGRESAILWTQYFCFEHRARNGRQAKLVFYRGLRAVPWVKGFAMLAFTHLRDVLGRDELLAVHSTMVDRGLRLRVELEDFQ